MMCSATQEGFRSLRSKEETRAFRVARSATGPGNPYWKRPAGSTGEMICDVESGSICGVGAGTEVVEVADKAVDEAIAWSFFSERVEHMAAVTAAPVDALTAAMMAIVVLDMVKRDSSSRSRHWGIQ